MGTLGRATRNDRKKAAKRRIERAKQPHPAIAKLAVALKAHKEALEQQAATAEILKVISSSPHDRGTVFEAILKSALRLCDAHLGLLNLREAHGLRTVAQRGGSAEFAAWVVERGIFKPDGGAIVQAVRSGRAFQVADALESADYRARKPNITRFIDLGGVRTFLAVPLLKDREVIGNIGIYRREVRPFTDRQIALLQTFADQAVIAIENARLFNETKEALEQQTGTSQVLGAISGSPTNVAPVYDTILENAMRLCEASFAVVFLYDGEYLRAVAQRGASPAFAKYLQESRLRPSRETTARLAALESRIVQVEDLLSHPHFAPSEAHRAENTRAVLSVPMLREGALIGVVTVWRREPRRFSDKQVALLKTFADQAVIAIENVRLFNETKEALERQTATAEVLRVISGSPTDVQPVFDAIAERAAVLCGAKIGVVTRFDGELLHLVAFYGASPELVEPIRAIYPLRPGSDTTTARAVRDRAPAQIPDLLADPDYVPKQASLHAGYRSNVAVPLLREGSVIGAISVARAEVGAFSDKEIGQLQTFADQAVIAIENVRLFNETKESLERQTATAEILSVIAASPSDVQPVFDTICASAARLCDAKDAVLWRVDGQALRVGGHFGELRVEELPLGRDSAPGLAALSNEVIHVLDLQSEQARFPLGSEIARRLGLRTTVSVPLVREGKVIGVITARRAEIQRFTDKQVSLLKTFADQAVIAIENVRLFNETKEALERQTATAEILRVMSSSPGDVQPVFDTIARNTSRLCNGNFAIVTRFDGELIHLVAQHNPRPCASMPTAEQYPRRPDRGLPASRAILEKAVVHVPYAEQDPDLPKELLHRIGARSFLAVPMLREAWPIGALGVSRTESGPFPAKQIELMKLFADQAVIAIENVRLFNETKESLEQQTAISEVLRAISNSPTDVKPVLEAAAARAARICDASDARIYLREGESLRYVAGFGNVSVTSTILPLDRGSPSGRAMIDSAVQHIEDILALPEEEFPVGRANALQGGWRTILSVPLLREGRALGSIVLRRKEVRPFSEKQIALLKTFADQAAIAIENVRLFNETKEALEQQTATAEILRVISSTPTDIQPVFDAIAKSAMRIFEGMEVAVALVEGNDFEIKATSVDHARVGVGLRLPLDRSSAGGLATLDRVVLNIADTESPEIPPVTRQRAREIGFRAFAVAPMLRENTAIGHIAVMRQRPVALSDKQIALLRTFADQAVIAIENARLFKELQERTEALTKSVGQLTALGEVGQAISSTLELETVLSTIVQRAVQLTGLDSGAIYEYDEGAELFRLQAAEKFEPELVEAVRRTPIRKGDGATGRIAVTLEAEQVPDIEANSYRGRRKDVLVRAGYRAVLAVPLLREDHLLGALQVFRRAPGPFAPEVVELLKTFATQSALAIQNARLFREIADKGRQLEVASRHKSQFLASMSHELRTPLNALLGFNEMILGDVYGEVPGDMRPPLAQMQSSGKHLLRLINNVLDLAKIEAGRMELALAEYSVQDAVEAVRSTLQPLAADKGLELRAAVPAEIPLAYGDPGRIAQCLMNLAGNSLKFTKAGKVEISVAMNDGQLRYSVADTGIGIPADKLEGLFTEFKQTDATVASEYGGTGLGLSISKKFVEMHGGRIWVESEPGKGSTFTFEVPLRTREATAA